MTLPGSSPVKHQSSGNQWSSHSLLQRPIPGLPPRWYYLRPHAQQALLAREARNYRNVILPCGRRSGKTEFAKRFLAGTMLAPDSNRPWMRRYFLGGPTFTQAKAIWWEDMKMLLRGFYHPRNDVSESELTIRLPFPCDAMVQVLGFDRPERFEGTPWDGGVLDEIADTKDTTWPKHVSPSLSDRRGWCWLIGVPEGRNHYWDYWQNAQTDPEWLALTWSARTVLDPAEIRRMESIMDARTIAQEIDAAFNEAIGRIYYNFVRAHSVKNWSFADHKVKPGTPGKPWEVGFDFNVNPLCAIASYDHDGATWWYRDWAIPNSNTEEAGKKVLCDLYGTDTWEEAKRKMSASGCRPIAYPDPTGVARKTAAARDRTDHSILSSLGFEIRTRLVGQPTRKARYAAVNSRLCNFNGSRHMFFHEQNCKHTIKCMEGQEFKEGTNDEDDKDPLGHANAAVGYLSEYKYPVRMPGGVEGGKF